MLTLYSEVAGKPETETEFLDMCKFQFSVSISALRIIRNLLLITSFCTLICLETLPHVWYLTKPEVDINFRGVRIPIFGSFRLQLLIFFGPSAQNYAQSKN